jgi:hypothetical protein
LGDARCPVGFVENKPLPNPLVPRTPTELDDDVKAFALELIQNSDDTTLRVMDAVMRNDETFCEFSSATLKRK